MSDISQFKYGDDGLDPAAMEGKGKQVDLPRVLQHVQVYYIVNCHLVHHQFVYSHMVYNQPVETFNFIQFYIYLGRSFELKTINV